MKDITHSSSQATVPHPSSLIMTTHKLVFLGDLDVKDKSFLQLLGSKNVRRNSMPVGVPV